MEEPKSPIAADANGLTKIIYDLTANANEPTIEVQQVHHLTIVAQELVSFIIFLSLPHVLARKIRRKEPLMDYN